MVNVGFFFVSKSITTTVHKNHHLLNRVSEELLYLDCLTEVQLQGYHVAKDFIVETESFTTNDMIDTAKMEIIVAEVRLDLT